MKHDNQFNQAIAGSMPKAKELSFFDLMERVGTMGKYQIICAVTLCLYAIVSGGLVLSILFVFHQEPYHCKDIQLQGNCLDYVCKLDPWERKDFVPKSSLFSLANKFGDYRCPDEKESLALLKSIILTGILFGISMLGLFGGMQSKTNFLKTGIVFSVIGTIMIIKSTHIMMGTMGLFLCLFGFKTISTVAFTFVSQIFSGSLAQKMSTILSTLNSAGGLFMVVCFYFFQDFEKVFLFCLIPLVLVLLSFFFVFRETPHWMITKLTAQEAFEGLQFIARLNQKREFNLTLEQVEEIQLAHKIQYQGAFQSKSSGSFTFMDLFRYSSLREITILLVILDVYINFIYYGPSLMLDRFNLSLYLNGVIVTGSQMAAPAITLSFIHRIPRRLLAFITMTIILVSTIMLSFIWNQNQQSSSDTGSSIQVLFFVFLIEMSISCYDMSFSLILNELYPTQVRMVGMSVPKALGAASLLLQPQINAFFFRVNFKIMTFYSILAAFAICCASRLPETLGVKPPDMIEELRRIPVKQQNFMTSDSK